MNKPVQQCLLLLPCMILLIMQGFSEGTKQVQPISFSGCNLYMQENTMAWAGTDNFATYDVDSNHCIYVEIKNTSEKLYMGFGHYFGSPLNWVKCRIKHKGNVVWGEVNLLTSAGPGYISTWYQAVAGPNVIDPAGYPPFVFSPPEPGRYIVEFDVENLWTDIQFFDFTVVDTSSSPLQAINGRVWSRNWEFLHATGINEGFHGKLYILTNDGMVDSIKYNKLFNCNPFQLNYNSNGCLPYPTAFEESRKSRIVRSLYPEFRVFFNDPDSTIFSSGIPGNIVPGSITVTPDCNGHYNIGYQTSKSGYAQIFIDINPISGVQNEDILVRDTAITGMNSFFWDGLDGTGVPVSPGSAPDIILTFMNGLINHPIYDFAQFDTGFIVGLKRPIFLQPKQYWIDSLIPGGMIQLDGCVCTLTAGCHGFSGNTQNCDGFGSDRTINTWWFSGIPDTLHNAFLVTVVPPPDSISGLHSLCYMPNQLYTYSLSPDSLIAAAGYEWQLFIDTTMIQSWTTSISTIDSVQFPGPGLYYLLGNGVNACGSGVADTILIDVYPSLSANITISASENMICEGTLVIYSASTANGGVSPGFQWRVNGMNQGSNDSVFSYFPDNGDTVTCILFSSISQCITNNPATSNAITMTVNQIKTVSISITPSANPICAGTTVTFTATPIYGGTTPLYQWKVNGASVGSNSPNYSFIPLNNDIITCTLTSSELCTTNNPATSIPITMTVNPLLPVSVSISASSNPFCIGGSVTFTATPTNGGTTPFYQWKVNGINTGTNSPTFIYNPVSGDVVSCVLTSSVACPLVNPVTSNTITMAGNLGLPALVSITANPNPFCPGTPVTFAAIPSNGGSNPSYQWKVNGVNAGSNSSTFLYNPANNDSVRCVMTSNLACVSGNPSTSNKIILLGTLAPMVTFSTCFDTVTTLNAKPIKLKGGIPFNGTYSGPGVAGGIFNPSTTGIGTKTITYTYTNAALCSASKTKTITVQANAAFTCGNNMIDIRDGKSYPTVQIGSQCWMAANLNYGTMILSSSHQRDNCITEKYCYNDLSTNCGNQTYYQWDEIMRYDDTPAQQGLCPPAWHVPSEAEWNTLFSNWSGNGFAGSPLKYSGFSGFNALLSGVKHQNVPWDFLNFATFFWTSTANGPYKAWAHGMNDYDPSVSLYPSSRSNAFSIRCLRD